MCVQIRPTEGRKTGGNKDAWLCVGGVQRIGGGSKCSVAHDAQKGATHHYKRRWQSNTAQACQQRQVETWRLNSTQSSTKEDTDCTQNSHSTMQTHRQMYLQLREGACEANTNTQHDKKMRTADKVTPNIVQQTCECRVCACMQALGVSFTAIHTCKQALTHSHPVLHKQATNMPRGFANKSHKTAS